MQVLPNRREDPFRPEGFPSCEHGRKVAPFDGHQLVGSGDRRFTIHDPASEVDQVAAGVWMDAIAEATFDRNVEANLLAGFPYGSLLRRLTRLNLARGSGPFEGPFLPAALDHEEAAVVDDVASRHVLEGLGD